MAEIIPFKKVKAAERHRGNTLCKRGFHKWKVDTEQQFDSKQGRLVTLYKCIRCGKSKNEAI